MISVLKLRWRESPLADGDFNNKFVMSSWTNNTISTLSKMRVSLVFQRGILARTLVMILESGRLQLSRVTWHVRPRDRSYKDAPRSCNRMSRVDQSDG